jgi:hypothetical protein
MTTNQINVFDAGGVARIVGKSPAWAHLAFARGDVPTELRLNGKRPVVTESTLKRLAPALRKRAPHGSLKTTQ